MKFEPDAEIGEKVPFCKGFENIMKHTISFLETTRLARKQVHRNLTLFPLLAPNGIKPDYLSLDQGCGTYLDILICRFISVKVAGHPRLWDVP